MSAITLGLSVNLAAAAADATCLFLLISPSPRANGLGQTFLSLPETDAMIAFYNPASLGIFALGNRVSLGFYPNRVSWLPGLTDELFYDCKAANASFRLTRNLRAGIGYHRIYLDLGKVVGTDQSGQLIGPFRSWEKADAFSAGIGLDQRIKAGIGLTIKFINNKLGESDVDGDRKSIGADGTAYDFGAMVQLPLLELWNMSSAIWRSENHKLYPFFSTTLAYTIKNIGDEISYSEPSQADPLPRTARIGYSFDLGMTLRQRGMAWKLAAFTWAIEAEDLLIKQRRPPDYTIRYQIGLGDIHFFHDLFGGKNPSIVQMRGWEINCLEVIYLQHGRYENPDGLIDYKTKGVGIGLAGWLKLMSQFFPANRTIKFVTDHFDLQYQWSEFIIAEDHPLAGTKFRGVNLIIR